MTNGHTSDRFATHAASWHEVEAQFLTYCRPGVGSIVLAIDRARHPEIPGERFLLLWWDGHRVHHHTTSNPLAAVYRWARWTIAHRALRD